MLFEISGQVLVGLGAFLAGCGSVISGIAALRAARRKREEGNNK